MSINIVAGRSGEINNQFVFSLLKNRDKSKRHIIIAPDRSQFSIEQRLFEETGEKCFFDIDVISLSRLSKKILTNTHKNILSKQSGVALVKKILQENKDKLVAFNKATSFLGFASVLFETICLYKSCNITPEQVYVDESQSLSNLKQKDIKLVYEEYEKYLKNEFTDSFNQLMLFADMIAKDSFPNTIFYFIEFDDFTRIMYSIISKLGRFADETYITCTYGKDELNSNIYSQKVYYDLIELFKIEGINYNILKPKSQLDSQLDYITSNVFSFNLSGEKVQYDNISIKSFENLRDEVQYIIADIYSRVLKNKNSFSDFAIVVPNLNEYKGTLKQILSKYDLPYYFDESEILREYHVVRLLFDILKLIEGDFQYSDFVSIIKSPLLNFDMDSVLNYDKYLKCITAKTNACINIDKTDNEDLIDFMNRITDVRQCVRNAETISDFIDCIIALFSYIEERASSFVESSDVFELRTFEQVKNKFSKICEDVCCVFGTHCMEFEKFLEVFSAYFESTNISLPPITSNTLFVADFNTSYITPVDYLYVMGNNEGKLPKQKLDNGLVTDDEIASLPNAKNISPTIAMLNARKQFKIFELLFRFKKGLFLSFCNAGSDGKMYPNSFVNSLEKIIDTSIECFSGALDVVGRSFYEIDEGNIIFNNLSPRVAEDNMIKYLSNWDIYSENKNYREILSSLYVNVSNECRDLIKTINSSLIIDNLKSHNFFASGSTSVSEIECFNKCAYMHFATYGLKLVEENNNTIKPIDIGNILHEVLSNLVAEIVTRDLSEEEAISVGERIFSRVLSSEKYVDKIQNIENKYIVRSLSFELIRIIKAINIEIQAGNFKPKYYEYKFDNILNCRGVNIKGFIDRIDVVEDGFIILDYKTGDNQFKNYNDVASGKKLQLLVYANAFQKKSNLDVRGVFYFPITNRFSDDTTYRLNGVILKTEDNIINLDAGLSLENYKSRVINLKTTSSGKIFESSYYKNMCLSREDFDYLLNFAICQVDRSVHKIQLGEINARPLVEGEKSVCDYCGYKAFCNFNVHNVHNVQDVSSIAVLKEMGGQDGKI